MTARQSGAKDDWNQGYHLVNPHFDAGQGKVVKLW